MFLRFLPQEFEVAFLGQDEAHVAGNGFDDDGGDGVAVLVHESFKGGGVVIRDGQGIFGRSGRNARAVGLAEGRGTTAGFDQEAVAVAVVAADEFDDFFPSRIAPGGTDGAHRRFGTGVDHAQFFNGRVDFSDQFGQIRFDDRRGAVAGTAFSCFLKGFDDAGVGVADDQWPRSDVVDVFVAVDVGNGTALAQAMNGGGQPMRL